MSGEKARYRVLRLSHIHNNLWPEGSEVEYDGEPGTALEPLNVAAKLAKEIAEKRKGKSAVSVVNAPVSVAVQPVVVQRDRRDSQFVPAKFFLVLAVRPHIVQMPLVPDGAELVEHFPRPFIAGAAFADFINALAGAATVATAAQRADNAGDAESAILKLDFAERPCGSFIAAAGVDLTETRANDLFHITLSPFVLLPQSCQCCD